MTVFIKTHLGKQKHVWNMRTIQTRTVLAYHPISVLTTKASHCNIAASLILNKNNNWRVDQIVSKLTALF